MIRIQKHFPTTSGTNLTIRLIESGDAANLRMIFDHLGPESRYQRFLQSVDNVSERRVEDEIAKMVAQIPDQGDGLIAFRDGRAVAAARYVKIGPDTAEIALSVIDEAQGQGIGSQLLPLLTELAYENGVTTLVGTVSNNNEPMWHMLNKLPYRISRYPEGTASAFELDLLS